MPMGFVDPNAAAAANASRGLGNLANFLYEQQVQKPAVQAQTAYLSGPQTAETQARTALMPLQADDLQQAVIAAQLQNKAAQLAQAHATLSFAPEEPTDVSTLANAPQSSTTTPPTGSAGGGYSGPAPSSSSISPLNNTPAGGTPNQAGSSRQGPDTISTNDDNDYLSPSVTRPGLRPFSDTPARVATTTPAPVTSPSSPVPAKASPAAPTPPMDLSQYTGQTFQALPPEAQQEVLSRGRKHFENAGVGGLVSDPEIAGRWNQLQASTIPPLNMQAGWTPVSADFNGLKLINKSALEGGQNDSGGQFAYDAYGNVHDRKDYATPEQVATDETDGSSLNRAQAMLNQAKAALKADPSLVGSGIGVAVGDKAREGKALVGSPDSLSNQNALDRFAAGEFLNILGGVHIGRVTENEASQFQKEGITRSNHTVSDWNQYFDAAQKALDARKSALNTKYKKETGQKLPDVDIGPETTAPSGGQAPAASAGQIPTLSAADIKQLPPDWHGSFKLSNGKVYTR